MCVGSTKLDLTHRIYVYLKYYSRPDAHICVSEVLSWALTHRYVYPKFCSRPDAQIRVFRVF